MDLSKEFLDFLFANDKFGILDKVELPKKSGKEVYDLGESKRVELQEWMDKHGREPRIDSPDINEAMLAKRRQKILQEDSLVAEKNSDSIESILNSDIAKEIISKMPDENYLHDFSNIPSVKAKRTKTPDYRAVRTSVKNFEEYKPMFDRAQMEIDSKARMVIPFSAHGIASGKFYIVGGILCYVDKFYKRELNSFGRYDKRMHLVFANGTESYMLYSTFQKIMSTENGRCVTEVLDNSSNEFELDGRIEKEDEKFVAPDVETGWIYILRTTSDDDVVKRYGKDLYKIGYTSKSVEERIKNAEKDPTYLCSPVVIVQTWKCLNLNSKKLETLLHSLFRKAQVRIRVNSSGVSQVASEWFNVPLKTIEEACPLIISGEIVNYEYDSVSKSLKYKRNT